VRKVCRTICPALHLRKNSCLATQNQSGIEGDELSLAGQAKKLLLLKFDCKTPFDQHAIVGMSSHSLAG
jgi:hypothetical protein